MISLIGTVLKDRYYLIEHIGHGGGGSLYLARDMDLGIFRAVKEIPVAKKKEAWLMRNLEHPSIPRIIDYVEAGEVCYLIMEYIKGNSVGELLRKGKLFSIQEIITLGKEIAKVMEYLHSQKPPVCYGDLKPDNLMLSETGHLYLVDLGSAVTDHGNRIQICEGTEGYAAPEQYQGYLSPRSDIYALGKTLESLLKGKLRLLFLYPEFLGFLFRCSRKREKDRYPDMAAVQKKLCKLERRYYTVTWRKRFLETTGVSVFIGILLLTAAALKTEEFSVALLKVTDLYYQAEKLSADSQERKEIYAMAEKKLQMISKNYIGKEEQRQVALLLAWNAELLNDGDRAALYYKNLLLYDERFRNGYGEYGMFLLRSGQEKASQALWKNYRKKEKKNLLEEEKGRNLLLWEEINEQKTEK